MAIGDESAVVRLHAGDPGPSGLENEVRDSCKPRWTDGRRWGYWPADAVFEFVNDDKIANVSTLDFGCSTKAWGEVSHVSVWWQGKFTNRVPLKYVQNCPVGVHPMIQPRDWSFRSTSVTLAMDDDDEAPLALSAEEIMGAAADQREAMLAVSREAARSMVRDAPLQWPELFERSANPAPSAAEIAADAAWNVKFAVVAAQPADPPLQGPPMPMPDKEPYPASLVERIAALERENATLRHEIDMGNAAEPEPVFPARALACWPGGAGGMARFLP